MLNNLAPGTHISITLRVSSFWGLRATSGLLAASWVSSRVLPACTAAGCPTAQPQADSLGTGGGDMPCPGGTLCWDSHSVANRHLDGALSLHPGLPCLKVVPR